MTHVVCLLNVESDRATFTWSEGPAAFEPYQLEGGVFSDFKEISEETREKLADLVKDYLYAPDNLAQSSYALAEAGHELYQQIFDPGAGQLRIAKQVRQWLAELRDAKAVDTMEIVMERPWALPWNLVYDEPPDRDAFLSEGESKKHWKPFWGLRYNLAGGRRVNPLRRMPLPQEPRVLMVLDPQIRDGLPDEQQQRLARFIETHRVQVATSKSELKDDARTERPDLLYWLSHATPEALVLGGEEVRSRDLRRLLRWESEDGSYELGGFAFLNACQTAESGEAGSFLDTLHSVGYSGMVGTEHQTVDTFAAPLGLDFLEAFLDRQEPVGKILRDLHGRVPLGLLYGAYCPPDLKLDEPATASIADSVKIESFVVEGTALAALNKHIQSPPLPDEPYRSLAYYGSADRALFAGRDTDVERFATLLDEDTTRTLVLHGESGVGKSSFLHAGVIPFLEEECVGYQFLRMRDSGEQQPTAADPVLFVRATNDPFGQLANALCEYSAHALAYPTPSGETATVDMPKIVAELLGRPATPDVIAAALREDATLLGRWLAAVSRALPFSLIITIDQCEEIFTLAETPDDVETARLALNMFRRTATAGGDFKLILSLRTEYYGRLIDRLRRGLQDASQIREYLLTDFDEASLIEAITRPTVADVIPHSSEVPRRKYGFHYAAGLPEEIARRVVRFSSQRRDSVLPLVQVICNQLYQRVRARDDKQITQDDLESLGGIEGGMRKNVENLIGELLRAHPADKKPLQKLFTQLYLRQPDGSLTTALLPEEEVQRRWSGRMPYAELIRQAEAMRLVRINTLRIGGGAEGRYVSLGHDSMAKLAAAWDEELSRGARMRKMFTATAAAMALALVMAILWIRAEGARIRADKARAAADTNRKFSRELMSDLVPELNKQATFPIEDETRLAKAARKYVKMFVAKKESESADTASLRADAQYVIGRLDVEMKEYPKAIAAYKKARELQLQCEELKLERDDPDYASLVVSVDNEAVARDLAYTLNALGDVYKRQGDKLENEALDPKEDKSKSDEFLSQARDHWNTARDWFTQAATIRGKINPEEIDDRLLYASAVMNIGLAEKNIGLAEKNLGEFDKARKHYDEAERIRRTLLEAVENETDKLSIERHIALGELNFAEMLQEQAKNATGEESQSRELRNHAKDLVGHAITLYEKQSEDDFSIQQELAICYRLCGKLQLEQLTGEEFDTAISNLEKLDPAEALEVTLSFEKAAEVFTKLCEKRAYNATYRESLLNLSIWLHDLYKADPATKEKSLESSELVKELRRLNCKENPNSKYLQQFGVSSMNYYKEYKAIVGLDDGLLKLLEKDVKQWDELAKERHEDPASGWVAKKHLFQFLVLKAMNLFISGMEDEAKSATEEPLRLWQELTEDPNGDPNDKDLASHKKYLDLVVKKTNSEPPVGENG